MRVNWLAWSNSKPAFFLPEAESFPVKGPRFHGEQMECANYLARFGRLIAIVIVPFASLDIAANLTPGEIHRVHVCIGQTTLHRL